jgi:hypothetical protein
MRVKEDEELVLGKLNKEEALEFLQLTPTLLTRGIVDIAKKIIRAKFPMSDGLGFPIRAVPSRKFTYVEPTALETEVAPEVAEKTECPLANLSDPTIPKEETHKYGVKEMITREAVEDAGWDIISNVINRLTQKVSLPVEKEVIDAMKATTCQTAGASACWDATTPLITKDLLVARRNLVKKGYPWDTHQLIVSPYDFQSMVLYFEGKGYLTTGVGRETPMAPSVVAKIVDMPVIIEPCIIGTTDILEDLAIVHSRDPDYGALFQRTPLKSRTWMDDAIEGARWVEMSREVLAKRIKNESVYTITNTVT